MPPAGPRHSLPSAVPGLWPGRVHNQCFKTQGFFLFISLSRTKTDHLNATQTTHTNLQPKLFLKVIYLLVKRSNRFPSPDPWRPRAGDRQPSCNSWPQPLGQALETSLLCRLQAQTLPDATQPIGKIYPFSKMPCCAVKLWGLKDD